MVNKHDSPLYDILRVYVIYGLNDDIMMMVLLSHMYSKDVWKKKMWERAWVIEDEDWSFRSAFCR